MEVRLEPYFAELSLDPTSVASASGRGGQTQVDRVDQGQDHLGELVVMVAPGITQIPSQEAA